MVFHQGVHQYVMLKLKSFEDFPPKVPERLFGGDNDGYLVSSRDVGS